MRTYIVDEHGVVVFLERPKATTPSQSKRNKRKNRPIKLSEQKSLANKTNSSKPSTRCDICGVTVKIDRIPRHLTKAHDQERNDNRFNTIPIVRANHQESKINNSYPFATHKFAEQKYIFSRDN